MTIRLSFPPALLEKISLWVKDYPASAPNYPGDEALVHKLQAIPIGFDMWVTVFLSREGQLFAVDPDNKNFEPLHISLLWQQLVFIHLAIPDHPELELALPTRPETAVECSVCGGRGVYNRVHRDQVTENWPCWTCGMLGWLEEPGAILYNMATPQSYTLRDEEKSEVVVGQISISFDKKSDDH